MANKSFNENSFPRKEVKGGVTRYYNAKGQLHRDYGPAYINCNTQTRMWFENGQLHREGAPAIDSILVSVWVRYGRFHREDGPAFEVNFPNLQHHNQWWIDGKQMTREEFEVCQSTGAEAKRQFRR